MIRTPLTENGLEWLDTQIWLGSNEYIAATKSSAMHKSDIT